MRLYLPLEPLLFSFMGELALEPTCVKCYSIAESKPLYNQIKTAV